MLSPCHKVAQIGGESGTDSVSDRLIDSGVCVASRREQVCFALLFLCVCVCVCVCVRARVWARVTQCQDLETSALI